MSCWGLAVRLCCPAATQHLWMLLWAQARTSAAAPALGLSACLPTQQTLAAGARTLLGMSAFQFLGYSNVYFGGSLAVPPYPPARACVHACECARACARECACVRAVRARIHASTHTLARANTCTHTCAAGTDRAAHACMANGFNHVRTGQTSPRTVAGGRRGVALEDGILVAGVLGGHDVAGGEGGLWDEDARRSRSCEQRDPGDELPPGHCKAAAAAAGTECLGLHRVLMVRPRAHHRASSAGLLQRGGAQGGGGGQGACCCLLGEHHIVCGALSRRGACSHSTASGAATTQLRLIA